MNAALKSASKLAEIPKWWGDNKVYLILWMCLILFIIVVIIKLVSKLLNAVFMGKSAETGSARINPDAPKSEYSGKSLGEIAQTVIQKGRDMTEGDQTGREGRYA